MTRIQIGNVIYSPGQVLSEYAASTFISLNLKERCVQLDTEMAKKLHKTYNVALDKPVEKLEELEAIYLTGDEALGLHTLVVMSEKNYYLYVIKIRK